MKIALLGYGKMGKMIESISIEKGHDVVLKITSKNQQEITPEKLSKADIAIEFSRPESAVKNILACFDANTPVVVGTTGWYDEFDKVSTQCKKQNGSLLYAGNFSIGVNIFFSVNRYLAKLMNKQEHYDVSISETHHIHKLDAPSGTAINLADDIISQIGKKKRWVNKETNIPEELSVISYRENEVPGTHEVHYCSEIDDIEIKHMARNRRGFASGAVLAAEWLQGKKGIFTMKDVLNL